MRAGRPLAGWPPPTAHSPGCVDAIRGVELGELAIVPALDGHDLQAARESRASGPLGHGPTPLLSVAGPAGATRPRAEPRAALAWRSSSTVIPLGKCRQPLLSLIDRTVAPSSSSCSTQYCATLPDPDTRQRLPCRSRGGQRRARQHGPGHPRVRQQLPDSLRGQGIPPAVPADASPGWSLPCQPGTPLQSRQLRSRSPRGGSQSHPRRAYSNAQDEVSQGTARTAGPRPKGRHPN